MGSTNHDLSFKHCMGWRLFYSFFTKLKFENKKITKIVNNKCSFTDEKYVNVDVKDEIQSLRIFKHENFRINQLFVFLNNLVLNKLQPDINKRIENQRIDMLLLVDEVVKIFDQDNKLTKKSFITKLKELTQYEDEDENKKIISDEELKYDIVEKELNESSKIVKYSKYSVFSIVST